jgi:hypothetical protein
MKRRSSLVALAPAALMLAMVSAAPATADTMVSVAPRATLVARGVAADIRLTYTCSPGADLYPGAYGMLSQAVRNQQVTTAWGGVGLVCDRKTHTALLRVTVEDWNPVLKRGPAVVEIQVHGTGDPDVVMSQEVRLVRK